MSQQSLFYAVSFSIIIKFEMFNYFFRFSLYNFNNVFLIHYSSPMAFLIAANNKMVVFNENKTLFFKLSIVGTWPSGTANRSMQLTFSGSVPDTLVSSRNAATTTDNILLATFFSVDKDGFLATNGSTLTIQSNGAAFTATTIKIIAEQ